VEGAGSEKGEEKGRRGKGRRVPKQSTMVVLPLADVAGISTLVEIVKYNIVVTGNLYRK